MDINKDYLLNVYGKEWGPEAGEWNTSVESRYLEFRIAQFFEENFTIPPDAQICNVGIGAGYWDRYLSYRLHGGHLTSIDIDEECCRQMRERLENEENPNSVTVICSDIIEVTGFDRSFDIVTLVGSTRREIDRWDGLFKKLAELLRNGGSLYYMELYEDLPDTELIALFSRCGLKAAKVNHDNEYGFHASYWKLERIQETENR